VQQQGCHCAELHEVCLPQHSSMQPWCTVAGTAMAEGYSSMMLCQSCVCVRSGALNWPASQACLLEFCCQAAPTSRVSLAADSSCRPHEACYAYIWLVPEKLAWWCAVSTPGVMRCGELLWLSAVAAVCWHSQHALAAAGGTQHVGCMPAGLYPYFQQRGFAACPWHVH